MLSKSQRGKEKGEKKGKKRTKKKRQYPKPQTLNPFFILLRANKNIPTESVFLFIIA
jgi:hypothetical protein